MRTVALICEGVSEIKMLTYIIEKYLGDNFVVNPIQPPLHGGKQTAFGGWYQVLEHCETEIVNTALATNDYLVVQIDTDTCTQKGYDVNIDDESGNRIDDSVLYARVVERLKKNISADTLNKHHDRILYAICINETECWLLPVLYPNDTKMRCATNNCIFKINKVLSRDHLGIPDTDKNSPQAIKAYGKILRKIKTKDIPKIASHNVGFDKFVQQMKEIKE